MKLLEPIRDWWNDDSEVRRDPIESAQQMIQRPTSTAEVLERAGMTAEEPTPTEPKETPTYSRLEKAKELYPYLKDKDFDYTEQLTDDEKAGFLEFWEPGDEGPPDGSVKRPEAIGIDRMGIEVRNDKTRPIDILGDYVSHEAVKSDPKLKDIYDRYLATLTDEQLRTKYEYEKKNYGEDRPFEQWAERSGRPGMFRGYTFDQFSEEEIKEAYTPEQLDILDEAKEYLNIDINRVKTEGLDKEEPIQETQIQPEEPTKEEFKMMEEDRSIVNDAYNNLASAEGSSGDTTGAAETLKRGLTKEQYERQKARTNNPNMTEEEASKAYLEELYVTFNNELEGFSELDYQVKSDILHEAYNLGGGMKNYKEFSKAIKDNNVEQIFFKLLDTANISGQTSKGIAVRRAKLYNKYADAKIKTVEQLDDGTLIYSTEDGELFRYRKAKHKSSKAGKVKL
jgi:hypothetical protein